MAPQDRRFSKYYVTSGQKRWERYPLIRCSGMLFMLLFSSLWLTACGGGGGGSETTPTPSTVSRVSSASASTQSAVNAVTQSLGFFGGTGSAGTRALSSARVEDLGESIQRFHTALETQDASTPRAVISCPNGGTLNTTTSGTVTTIVFTNCRTIISVFSTNDAAQVINGSLSISQTASTFSLTATNLTISITRLSNNTVLEQTTGNFTLTSTTQSSSFCAEGSVLTAFTLTLNGTISLREDVAGNGTINVDQIATAQNFTMTGQVTRFDASSCTPLDLSVSVSGTLAVTDNLNSNETFTLTSSTSNPLTIALTTVTGGRNVTIGGSFAVSSACFTGSLTITTSTPLFYPTGSPCPTRGVLTVTGDQTGTITYTATGGVTITASDGSTQNFPTCSSAQACL